MVLQLTRSTYVIVGTSARPLPFLPAATEVQGEVEAGLLNDAVGMQVDTIDMDTVMLVVAV